eukprot:363680-Chlamydomonas_euryale.AAC.5
MWVWARRTLARQRNVPGDMQQADGAARVADGLVHKVGGAGPAGRDGWLTRRRRRLILCARAQAYEKF